MQSIGKRPKEDFRVSGYCLDWARTLRFVVGLTPEFMVRISFWRFRAMTWSRSLSNLGLSKWAWMSMYFMGGEWGFGLKGFGNSRILLTDYTDFDGKLFLSNITIIYLNYKYLAFSWKIFRIIF